MKRMKHIIRNPDNARLTDYVLEIDIQEIRPEGSIFVVRRRDNMDVEELHRGNRLRNIITLKSAHRTYVKTF